jgi:hypothetical protein
MAEKTAKVRTAGQSAANAALKEASEWLRGKGLSPAVPNPSIYMKAKKEGKSDEEIVALIQEKQAERAKTRTNKAAAKATTKKANAPAAAAVAAGPSQPATAVNGVTAANAAVGAVATKKNRSNKQLAADKELKNTAAAMKAKGIKFTGPSYKEYKAAKAAGRNNSEIFEELKAKYPTVNAEGKPIVTKRTSTKKNVAAKANNGVGAAPAAAKANNGVSAVKGSYVCEKCRLVANNTRKNNKKNNAKNYYSYENQGY